MIRPHHHTPACCWSRYWNALLFQRDRSDLDPDLIRSITMPCYYFITRPH